MESVLMFFLREGDNDRRSDDINILKDYEVPVATKKQEG